MSPAPEPRSALLTALLGPPALALVLSLSDRLTLGALLLLAEPLWVAVAVWGVLATLVARRAPLSLSLLLGTAAAVGVVHRPIAPVTPQAQDAEWTRNLRGCALVPAPVTAPVRVLLWTLSADERWDALPALTLQHLPDLVVLRGPVDESLRAELELLLQGEALLAPAGGHDGLVIAVRGSFQFCGGERDRWPLALPGASTDAAGLVVTFPAVRDVGVLPFMALRLERPSSPVGWASRLDAAAGQVASVAQAIGVRHLILAGDLQAPRTWRSMSGRLIGPGLIEAQLPPGWPSRVGALPFLPLFSLDRVLAGPGWRQSGTWSLTADTVREPVMVELSPTDGVAGG